MKENANGTVLITGASSGFGEACARRFAEDGRPLILAARRKERLVALEEELSAKTRVVKMVVDVRDRRDVEKKMSDLQADFRPVRILVNNAGLALGLGPAQEQDVDDWETMVDTNIKGLLYFTRLVLPEMVKENSGHIVNIGSIAGQWPYPGGNVYGATKAFVKQFSLNLRSDLSGTAVRVTNIEPGLAETEFSIVRFRGDREKAAEIYDKTAPLTGEDIAEMIHWVTGLPPHVNVNRLEVMPVCQSWAMFQVAREKDA